MEKKRATPDMSEREIMDTLFQDLKTKDDSIVKNKIDNIVKERLEIPLTIQEQVQSMDTLLLEGNLKNAEEALDTELSDKDRETTNQWIQTIQEVLKQRNK